MSQKCSYADMTSGSIIKPNWILVPIFAFTAAVAKFNHVFCFYFNFPEFSVKTYKDKNIFGAGQVV